MFKKITLVIIPLFLFFLQNSFFSALPAVALCVNILIIYCVLALLLTNVRLALLNALFFGVLTDLYAVHPFGISMLTFCAAVTIANVFLQQFFTNKSIYSFISLMALATISFLSIQAVLVWSAHFFIFNPLYASVWTAAFVRTLVWQTLGNTVIAAVSFYPIHYFSTKLKPFLLQRHS